VTGRTGAGHRRRAPGRGGARAPSFCRNGARHGTIARPIPAPMHALRGREAPRARPVRPVSLPAPAVHMIDFRRSCKRRSGCAPVDPRRVDLRAQDRRLPLPGRHRAGRARRVLAVLEQERHMTSRRSILKLGGVGAAAALGGVPPPLESIRWPPPWPRWCRARSRDALMAARLLTRNPLLQRSKTHVRPNVHQCGFAVFLPKAFGAIRRRSGSRPFTHS